MDLSELIRRRRMVHQFEATPVPADVLDRILESALHAPSAGFSQGLGLVVLDDPADLVWFWETTEGAVPAAGPPVIVIVIPDKRAYLERYSRPDKGGVDGPYAREAGWPVPYWEVDAGMACMLMLLKAVDEGVGGWVFGFTSGEAELCERLGVPEGLRPIGALGFGYRAPGDKKAGSSVTIPRRSTQDLVHRGRW
jgi:nitroreductase